MTLDFLKPKRFLDHGGRMETRARISASHRQPFLDLARGLAALAVLAGHLRSFVFVDLPDVQNHNAVTSAFYALTGLGHQAVMVFFVLSGFLIGNSVRQAAMRGDWSWRRYAIQRLTRLWVVLLPALLITAALDHLGVLLGHRDFFAGEMEGRFNSGPASAAGGADWSVSTLAGNALFLQTIRVPVFGSNGPLWSLANEFWYYVLFPLAFFSLRGRISARFSCAAAFVLIGAWLPRDLLLYGAIWLLGYGAALAAKSLQQVKAIVGALHVLGPALVATALAYTRAPLQPIPSDWTVALAFSVWIVPLSLTHRMPTWMAPLVHGLADMSYTLYLVHFPFVALIVLQTLHGAQLQPTLPGFLAYAGYLAAALAFAGIVYSVFERRTSQLQRSILAFAKIHPAG